MKWRVLAFCIYSSNMLQLHQTAEQFCSQTHLNVDLSNDTTFKGTQDTTNELRGSCLGVTVIRSIAVQAKLI